MSVELDKVFDIVFVFIADGAQLGVLHQVGVMFLAIGVGTMDAETSRSFSTLDAVVPRTKPLLPSKETKNFVTCSF